MLLIFLVFMIGILFFIYWIPKKLGHPKVGKYLSIGLAVLLVMIITYGIFQDAFFTKNQAEKLLAEQDIILEDDFKVLNNKTSFAIGDYYHRFRLEISDDDKNRIIEEIKNSEGFKNMNDEKEDFYSKSLQYHGPKISQNYEDNEKFVREFLKSNGEGYAQTYRIIQLEKNDNKLVFEEIDE
jgi:hypothetical protein